MFRREIKKAIEALVLEGTTVLVSVPEQSEHGDYSSNVALVVAKILKKNPMEVAEEIKLKLGFPREDSGQAEQLAQYIERVEIVNPGFLNFWIKKEALIEAFKKPVFAKATKGETKKICLEFVSANPTGPLTMANGRGGFYGDVLARVLKAVGHTVTREYYINDAGNQIKLLGESIAAAEGKIPEKEEHYQGEYIQQFKGKTAEEATIILLQQIKDSLKRAGIDFDVWFSENEHLHKKGELEKTLQFLEEKQILRKKEGATWLDENVVIKSDGAPTYFLADLAYHYDKFIKRKFDIAINIWGADHHGYIARMKKGVEALGIDPHRLHIIIMQLVHLISGGKEVRMSKRTGEFVTMDDLLEMVGLDAARWFFLERSPNTHMDFDLDLARERSKKNPVYYVQYAYARAASILRTAKSHSAKNANLLLLVDAKEHALIKKILQLSEVIEDVAKDYQVQRMPRYAYELAHTFTDFYENCRVIDENNKELTAVRFELVFATQKTLAYTLSLMGIAAPEEM